MTPEEQRIAIAEACGLRFSDREYQTAWPKSEKYRAGGWYKGDKFVGGLPDYLNDLNAMHEAEKVLMATDDPGFYIIELGRAVDKLEVRQKDHNFSIIHATAAQRAEAFLRTLGKWKE